MLNPDVANTAEDLEKLAETCLAAARTLKSHLAENGHPQPSFDQNGPASWPDMNGEATQARTVLRNASKMIFELASGPDDVLGQRQHSALMDINAFRYVYRFKLAYAVPLNDMISYQDLASATGTDSEQLKQILRQLMTIHVFYEPKPDFVAHTAASKLLQNWGLDAYIGWTLYDMTAFVANQTAALEKWGHGSQELNQAALHHTYDTEKTMFQALEERPEARARFSKLMTYVSAKHISSIEHLKSFDWAGLGDSVIVDVGGDVGHCSSYIAAANPRATCVVQDLPHVIERAENPETCIIPQQSRDRVKFMVHNFYNPQPIHSADVYFLRMILHTQTDKYAKQILQSLVTAMKPGHSKIVIMDIVNLPVGSIPLLAERAARSMDLTMMLLSNARERDLGQWTDLLAGVDRRLKITQVLRTPESVLQIIVVDFEDKDISFQT